MGKIMILQGVGHHISRLGVCYTNDPHQGGYTTHAPALDLETCLQSDVPVPAAPANFSILACTMMVGTSRTFWAPGGGGGQGLHLGVATWAMAVSPPPPILRRNGAALDEESAGEEAHPVASMSSTSPTLPRRNLSPHVSPPSSPPTHLQLVSPIKRYVPATLCPANHFAQGALCPRNTIRALHEVARDFGHNGSIARTHYCSSFSDGRAKGVVFVSHGQWARHCQKAMSPRHL